MKKQLSFLLAFLLVITSLTPVFALESNKDSVENTENLVVEKTDALINLEDQVDGKIYDEEIVPVIISFNTDYFSHLGSPASVEELKTDAGKNRQMTFANKVNKEALSMLKSTYPSFDLLYELNLLMVGVTGNVSYKTAKEIASEPYIENIEVCREFNRPTQEQLMSTYMSTSGKMVEADRIHSRYKGEKQVVAVLDTGVELDHEAFYLSDGIEVKLKEEDVQSLLSKNEISPGKYHNEKIPFYYNYADGGTDVRDSEEAGGFHGYHVSGTILGNKVPLPDGSEFIGIAPEAQLLAMKVFSSKGGGTGSGYYVKAIEDSVKLGASSVNMSLGSPAGNVTKVEKIVNEALKKASDIGCVVAIAAGNESQFGYDVSNPDAHNPDYGIVGSPSVASLGLSVASMENTNKMATLLTVYVEGKEHNYPYNIKGENIFDPEKKYSYVYANLGRVPADAKPGEDKIDDFEGLNLEGKVALIERGGNTFSAKAKNAEERGAIAVLIFNHEAGGDDTINMAIEGVKIPVLSIGHSAGLLMKNNQEQALFSVSPTESSVINPNGGEISDFSNWGPSAEGTFKPEILAPGGHIYSTMDNNGYGDMSGTSMATPHVAGGIALVRQRVNEEFPTLSGEEKFNLVKQLLMSTAFPHEDKNGIISSPRHQGAGIMKLNAAVNTPAIVSNPDKDYSAIALGDVGNSFSFDVKVKNLSDKTLTYKYYTNVTTDEVVDGKFTLKPRFLYKTEPQTVTIGPNASELITINVDASQYEEELKDLMPNGYFLEGFVIFESDSEVQISYPFVGFKGSWEKLAVLEPSIYDLVKEGRLPFYYDKTGQSNDFTHFNSTVDGKNVIAGSSVDFTYENPTFEEKIYMSPNNDGNMDKITFVGTFLRNYSSIEGYLFDSVDGEKSGEGTRIFYPSSGIKNHYSGGGSTGRWKKSTSNTWSWYFDGKRSYKALPDGDYIIGISTTAMGARPDGSKYEPQWQYYNIYIDTVAPEIKNLKLNEDKFTFDIVEEGSDLRSSKVFYVEEDKEIIIEANSDGSYTIPEGISQEKIKIQAVDKAFNKFEDSLDILLYEGSLGSLNVKVKADKGEPTIKYKVVKADDESLEMSNLDKLPVGNYILIIEDVGQYKNLTGSRIPFSITEEELNVTIDIELQEIKFGQIFTRVSKPEDLSYDKVEIIAKDKENPANTYTLKNSSSTPHFFSVDVPYGDYELEVKVPEGYNVSFNKDVVVDKKYSDTIAINIVEGELAVLKIEQTFEDGSSHNIEYEVFDLNSGTTFPVGKLGNSDYLVYPLSVPEGYYADPQYHEVSINNIDERALRVEYDDAQGIKYYILEFKYKLQSGTGNIKVNTTINGDDEFTPKYIVKDFYANEGLGEGKTYEDLTNIPYGTYFVKPVEDTVNKNYSWSPKFEEVKITKEEPNAEVDFTYQDLRKSDKKGKLFFLVNTDNIDEFLLMVDFDIIDANGKAQEFSYSIFGNQIELPYGYYEIKAKNLPAGVVAKPETVIVRLDKSFQTVNVALEYDSDQPSENGRVTASFVDKDGKEVPGGEITIEDTSGKMYENGKLPSGTYVVRVKKAPEGYKIIGRDSTTAFISDFTKEAKVSFNVEKIGGESEEQGSIVLKFYADYLEKEFVEGVDYKFEGVYKTSFSDPSGYEKVSDKFTNLPNGVLYVKLQWLNSDYTVDNYRGEYFFAMVEGPNSICRIYLNKNDEEPVTELQIKEIEEIKLQVAYGTKLANVKLPETVKVKVEEVEVASTLGTEEAKDYTVKVNWNLENANYKEDVAGTYTITGTLDEGDLEEKNLVNTENLQAKAQITVEEKQTEPEKPVEPENPVDTSKLRNIIAIANSIDGRDYTFESYDNLMRLVGLGEKLLTGKASQEEIDRMTANISMAIDRLVRSYNYSNPFIDWHIISPIEVPVKEPMSKTTKVKDYKDHWAQDVIDLVVEKGYMNLDEKGNFNPEVKATRLTIVKALALIENINPKDYMGKSLKDVDAKSIESGYINWAIAKGIIDGYEDGTFKADREITREEMAKILNRYVENLNKDRPVLEDKNFNDQEKIQDWAKEDVKKAVERGLMQGTDENNFEPRENITRAQVAQIIYNIIK